MRAGRTAWLVFSAPTAKPRPIRSKAHLVLTIRPDRTVGQVRSPQALMTFTTAQLGHAFSYPQLRAEVPFKMSLALLSRLPVAPAALLIIYGAVRYGVDLSNIAVHWWNDLFWSVASLLAGIECLRVHRNLKDQSRAWLFFGLAHLSYFVGMLVRSFHELVLGQLNPFPSLADIGFLAVALFFALGISGANPESRRWGLNFSKVATIATGTLLITAVWLADAVAEAQTDWLYTTVAMAWGRKSSVR